MKFDFTLNGTPQSVDVDPDMPLLWVIRNELKLTGTKFGCGIGQCGACSVHIDGELVRSCVTPVEFASGAQITTIDGSTSNVTKALQAEWVDIQVPQCGYCQSGQIMAATTLLEANTNPSDEDIDNHMTNICRCGTYPRIRAAIHRAAARLRGDVA